TAQTVVRYPSTSSPCCRKVVTTVKMRSTNRLPLSLCVPNDFLRQITARRSGLSALLLVGSTPSTRTKVQRDSHSFKTFWQVWHVLGCVESEPACSNSFTCR